MEYYLNIRDVLYEFFQNGRTIYIRNTRPFHPAMLHVLRQSTGEIFLCRIPSNITPELIALIASHCGEIYLLRFKVTSDGKARGFAFLQYCDPRQMQSAIINLPKLFISHRLGRICAVRSRNFSDLVLRNAFGMTPVEVEQMLLKFVQFRAIVVRVLEHDQIEYKIVFSSNMTASRARNLLSSRLQHFGQNASIAWDRGYPAFKD